MTSNITIYMQANKNLSKKKLHIFTWNIHGTYLNTLAYTEHHFYLPVKEGRPYNYDGKTAGYEWPQTVHEITVDQIPNVTFDAIILHTPQQVLEEQNFVLSEEQRRLSKIFSNRTNQSIIFVYILLELLMWYFNFSLIWLIVLTLILALGIILEIMYEFPLKKSVMIQLGIIFFFHYLFHTLRRSYSLILIQSHEN